jgi:predicted dithiol-disulfide oxidoreductase (DUF899 family)
MYQGAPTAAEEEAMADATPGAAHRVVDRTTWTAARKALLEKEKTATRARDALAAERRALPWVRIEKSYVFQSPTGPRTLGDLFDGRSQLIVQHFMFGPEWEAGCIGCSFGADHIEAALVHLNNHDVSVVRVSRAPLAKLLAYGERMGWRAPWVSSHDSDFNHDFHVSFTPEQRATGTVYYNYDHRPFESEEMSGLSVFHKDEDEQVFHTYSTYGRGDELVDSTYMLLDMTPKGRNETGPNFNLADWVRRHDEYGTPRRDPSCCD